MNFRRFAVILTCVSGGMLLLALYTQSKNPPHSPATAPADGAATAPSAALAATAAPSASPSPATVSATPAATSAPAAAPAIEAASGSGSTTAPAASSPGGKEPIVPWEENDTLNFRLGSLDKASGYKFQIDLVNESAGIVDIQLSEFYATIEDKTLANKLKNGQAYLREVQANPGKYQGYYTVQRPLGAGFQNEKTAEGLAKGLDELKKQLQELEVKSKELEKRRQEKPPGFFDNDLVHLPLATRKITITFTKPGDEKTVTGTFSWSLYNARWILLSRDETKDSQSISFYWPLKQGGKEIFRLVKTYTVKVNDYSMHVSLEAKNSSGEPMVVNLEQAGPTSLTQEDVRSDERRLILGRGQLDKATVVIRSLADGSAGPKSIKDLAQNASDDAQLRSIERTLLSGSPEQKADLAKYLPDGLPLPVLDSAGQPVSKMDASWWRSIFSPSSVQSWVQFYPALGRSDTVNPVLWMGTTNKFFTAVIYPQPLDGGILQPAQYRAFEVGDSKTYRTEVNLEQIKIAPGKSGQVSFDFFAGPKDRDMFKTVPLYSKLNYDGTIETGSCCGITWFNWLTPVIMWLLEHIGQLVGNYGVGIIILVIIVRVLLHPLTKKGQVSMMKMQKLGPKMQALKEKYKDDKDALQRETMKFYKEQGTTPILGCLPMLLQMPIWIALYTGLNADVALRQTAFLPVWITDLAGQDAVYHLPWAVNLPLLGSLMGPIVNINLLPILLTIAMYYQTKLTPTSMGAGATPQQASQQKMMKYMSPAMMLVFFYNAPAGLNLYIMTSTFSGVFEQIIIRRHIKDKEAAEAAAETQVVVPGKGARGFRAKKPKGPFWTKRG